MVFDKWIRSSEGQEKLRRIRETKIWSFLWHIKNYLIVIPNLRYCFVNRNDKRKTVLIMVPSMTGGGAERVATILASELAKRYRTFLLYVYKRNECYPLSPQVNAVRIPRGLNGHKKSEYIRSRYVKFLKSTLKADVTISFMYNMNALNLASKAKDVTIVCERCNPTKNKDRNNIEEIKDIYKRADLVVFQTSLVKDLFENEVADHFAIMPNPVTISCSRKKEIKHRIINCGRLVPQKNQKLLIEAFAEFYRIHPEYTLSIYGEGILRETLTQLIKEQKLEKCVFLEGRSNNIHEEISDGEIFVLSSDYEGFSNALLEAMMMGFPVISTDCEGSTDLISNGKNGLLIRRGDKTELTSAILQLAENEACREELGRRAKKSSESYKREKAVEKWIEMIEQF